ncbi:7456_t:CDS:1, partial [Racocetra fulgida]
MDDTYEGLEDKKNEYYSDENEYINHLVEFQVIKIVDNNLENM